MTKPATMRRRLLGWLLPSTLVLSMVWLWGSYAIVIHFANLAYDRSLEDAVETIARQVRVKDGRFVIDLPSAARRMLAFDRVDRIYYAVTDEQYGTLIGNIALPGPRSAQPDATGNIFYDGVVKGRSVRIVQGVIGDGGQRRLSIRVAETRRKRTILAREVMTYMIAPQLLFLTCIVLLIWVGVGRGVAPLARVRDAITRLDPKNLRQIQEDSLPAELEEQVRVINHLINRLAESMAAQQRFVADASHQLRTPVANIRTQVELALRTESYDAMCSMLGRIDMASSRLVRLTEQLLALSRIEAIDHNAERFSAFAIEEALLDVAAGSVPAALLKDIDISVQVPQGETRFYGDRHAIEQLFANLVDNAVLYTPHGGRVLISTSVVAGAIHIIVEDSGPGISEYDRGRVLERFSRGLKATGKGTGLGLSIASEVVRLHRGFLCLQPAKPTGVSARIVLPMDFRNIRIPNSKEIADKEA